MIEFRIVAVPDRLQSVTRIAKQLQTPAQVFWDNHYNGARWNHLRALTQPVKANVTHVVILEDDAEPVPDFNTELMTRIQQHPDDLQSMYLGTGRPVYTQQKIDRILEDLQDDSFMYPSLFHGVCYVVPVNRIHVFQNPSPTQEADFCIGETWNRDIRYWKRSIVDHADEQSVNNSLRLRIPRKARFL